MKNCLFLDLVFFVHLQMRLKFDTLNRIFKYSENFKNGIKFNFNVYLQNDLKRVVIHKLVNIKNFVYS